MPSHLPDSQVRGDNGALHIVHAISSGEGSPFRAFGTRASVRGLSADPDEGEMISAILDIRTPLRIDARREPGALDLLHAGDAGLEAVLESGGYDGLAVILGEDTLWRPRHAGQVTKLAARPASTSRDVADLDFDAFVGPHLISPTFEVRESDLEDSYGPIFEIFAEDGATLPPLHRDEAGWEVRWVPDFEPEGSVVLADPDGALRGFYSGGTAWIAPEARGAGRSAQMILVSADIVGGSPTYNVEGLGFSEAGIAAHLRAWHLTRDAEPAPEPGI